MESNDLDYYLLQWDDPTNSIPLIRGIGRIGYLSGSKPIDNITGVRMEVYDPIPKNPLMADYIGPKNVFSQKIGRVFKSLELDYLQFVPVILEGKNKEEYDYVYVRICNAITCIDIEKSDCKYNERFNIIKRVKSIVFDEEKLMEIPLEKRLIFTPERLIEQKVFHKSVVDKIMAVEPVGIKFIKVEDFQPGM